MMKSYSEVIDKMGNQLFGAYMGGSNNLGIPGTGIIAFIYDVPEKQVWDQIHSQFEKVKDAYYDKQKEKSSRKDK